MIVRAEATVEVKRPVANVFAFVSKIENNPRFHERAVVTWRPEEGELALDGKWRAKVRFGGMIRQFDFRVTEFVPNRRFMSWTRSGRIHFGTGCAIEPHGNATRVTCIREMELSGWKEILRPIVAARLRREINREALELQRELSKPDAASINGQLDYTEGSTVAQH